MNRVAHALSAIKGSKAAEKRDHEVIRVDLRDYEEDANVTFSSNPGTYSSKVGDESSTSIRLPNDNKESNQKYNKLKLIGEKVKEAFIGILRVSITILLILLMIGMISDAIVWGKVGKFYTLYIPLHGLFACFLIFLSKFFCCYCIDHGKSESQLTWNFTAAVFMLQFVFLNFYVIGIFGQLVGGDINHHFYANKQMHSQLLGATFRTADSTFEAKTIGEADGIEDFWSWITGPIVNNFICDPEDFRENNVFGVTRTSCHVNDGKYLHMSPISFRTLRTKRRKCSSTDSKMLCTSDYSDETEEKDAWQLPLMASKYCSNSANQTFLTTSSIYIPTYKEGEAQALNSSQNDDIVTLTWKDGTYERFNGERQKAQSTKGHSAWFHRGGYRFYLYPDLVESKDQARTCLTRLSEIGFVDFFTRVVFVDQSFFINDIESYHSALVSIEFFTNGATEIFLYQNHAVIPNFATTLEKPAGLPHGPIGNCDDFPEEPDCEPQPYISLYIHISLVLNYGFNVYFYFYLFNMARQYGAREFFSDGVMMTDLTNYIMLSVAFIFLILSQRSTPSDLRTEDSDVNYYMNLERYTLALAVMFFWFRLTEFFALTPSTSFVAKTLMQAHKDVLSFLLLFLVIMCGFSINFYLMFGNLSEEFQTPYMAFFSCVRLLTGDVDADTLTDQLPALTLFLYSLFIFFVVFTLLTIMIAILSSHFDDAIDMMKEKRKKSSSNNASGFDDDGNDDETQTTLESKNGKARREDFYETVNKMNGGFYDKRKTELEKWVQKPVEGKLKIVLWSAENLDPSSRCSSVDSYTKMAVISDSGNPRGGGRNSSARTRTIFNTTNPSINYATVFNLESESDLIRFAVYVNMAFDDDLYLGECTIPVSDFTKNPNPQEYELMDRRSIKNSRGVDVVAGTLRLSACISEDTV